MNVYVWCSFQLVTMSLASAGVLFFLSRILKKTLGPDLNVWLKRIWVASFLMNVASLSVFFWLGRKQALASPVYCWARFIVFAVHYGFFFILICIPFWLLFSNLPKKRRISSLQTPSADPSRRQFLKALGVSSPLIALGAIPTMVLRPKDWVLRQVAVYSSSLPEDLDGFKIGQISDAHLGTFVRMADLERAIEFLAAQHLDLFCMTGDLSDDSDLYPPAIRVLNAMRTKYGSYACLGNHEYYVGLPEFRRLIDRSDLRLLVDARDHFPVGAARIELVGLNFPKFDGLLTVKNTVPAVVNAFGHETGEREQDSGSFRLCLAHHPGMFDQIRAFGADLTLSGHIHGFQMRLFGKSLAQPFIRYVDGLYSRSNQQLFVSSGMGHWMPLRFNCPTEVVVLTLHRGDPARSCWSLRASHKIT